MKSLEEELAAEAGEIETGPSDNEMGALTEGASELVQAAADVETAERELREAKDRLNEIRHRKLPDLMSEIGVDRLGLPGSDADIVLEPYYHASLPNRDREPDRNQEALDWLTEAGHGDLITATVKITLPKEAFSKTALIVSGLADYLDTFDVQAKKIERDLGVHWGTLTSFVREQTEAGVALPLDLLGATVGQVVKIKKRKS